MNETKEKCGVFGIYGKGLDVARLAYFGLYALQHRGQESAGIVTSDGERLRSRKDMGLVSQVFDEESITNLHGHIAVGHTRYSTSAGSRPEHIQPIMGLRHSFALAHNGNIPSTTALWNYLRMCDDVSDASDSRIVVDAISAAMKKGATLENAVMEVYPFITGAFSILIMGHEQLIAIRDRCGIRPLSIGKIAGSFVFASETCALQTIGAEYIRDVEPGEMVIVDENGLRSIQLAVADPKFDVFEFVYFARQDSTLLGKSVYEVRKNFGRELSYERKIKADVIVPVPETAIPMAIGYAQASGIPFEFGLSKNRYIQRTFIQPEQHLREQGVKMKLMAISEVLKGKRVIVIDDSIVRGTTSRQIVKMLFEAGAKEVHFLVSSPPVKFPDFYGIDTPRQDQLVAAMKSEADTCKYLGATSLQYLSLDGLIKAIGVPESQLNTSCFTGKYPIDIGEHAREIVYDVQTTTRVQRTRHSRKSVSRLHNRRFAKRDL
jgi:amidophosphoribosyltransferase